MLGFPLGWYRGFVTKSGMVQMAAMSCESRVETTFGSHPDGDSQGLSNHWQPCGEKKSQTRARHRNQSARLH